MTQGQFFKRSLTGLNSQFSFSWTSYLTKAEKHSLSYYLPIAGGRIIGFIPFPRVLVLCEMQWVSSRIWTRVAVSISYDDNHYTTGTSKIGALCTVNTSNWNNICTVVIENDCVVATVSDDCMLVHGTQENVYQIVSAGQLYLVLISRLPFSFWVKGILFVELNLPT